MKTIQRTTEGLTLRETDLFREAVQVAIGAYHSQLPDTTPAFGVDDQPSRRPDPDADTLMRASATLAMIAGLKTLLDDIGRADRGLAPNGPIEFLFFADDGDPADRDSLEVTLAYDGSPTSPAHLILLAIFNANLAQAERHVPTMTLLGRLL